MKEILTWDNVEQHFKRLGITPAGEWKGRGWTEDDAIGACQLTDEDFSILESDSDELWHELGGAWRYAEGMTPYHNLSEARVNVNGHYLKGFKDANHAGQSKYKHLLQYLCYALGVSTERNVTAVAVELAKMNGLTLVELFKKYQGSDQG